MKWKEYPDDRARRTGHPGVERTGVVWSAGPTVGTRWVMQTGKTDLVLLHPVRGVIPGWYSVKEGD